MPRAASAVVRDNIMSQMQRASEYRTFVMRRLAWLFMHAFIRSSWHCVMSRHDERVQSCPVHQQSSPSPAPPAIPVVAHGDARSPAVKFVHPSSRTIHAPRCMVLPLVFCFFSHPSPCSAVETTALSPHDPMQNDPSPQPNVIDP